MKDDLHFKNQNYCCYTKAQHPELHVALHVQMYTDVKNIELPLATRVQLKNLS